MHALITPNKTASSNASELSRVKGAARRAFKSIDEVAEDEERSRRAHVFNSTIRPSPIHVFETMLIRMQDEYPTRLAHEEGMEINAMVIYDF